MLRSQRIVRLVTTINLCIFVLYVIPATNRLVDRGFGMLERVNADDLVGRSLQIWLVGSTLVATALFVRMVWRKVPSAVLDGMLLLTWWAVALGSCAYAYMMGLGS